MEELRHIVHLDMDTFFVSVERNINTSLEGKPVLIGGFSDRAVVASCSYEARRFGVHSAMPMRLARQLCPEAIIIRGDMDMYSEVSAKVTDIIAARAPLVEKASIDEHYIDISGMDRFFGCWKWTQELRREIIKETGLPVSFGLSANKTVAKIATGEAKPSGEKKIDNGTEKSFLAPLSIRKIPMVGARTYLQLRNMGISRIHTLQEMDPHTMQRVMGQNGIAIWKKANGLDNAPVIAQADQKSMSKERTFEADTIDMNMLKKVMMKMTDELCFDLRKEKKLTGCLTLKIRYSNFETFTKQQKITYSCSEKALMEKTLDLFKKLYSKRMLIRLIGIRFGDLISGSHQVDLFNDVAEEISLMQAIDRIRMRFGTDKIMRGIYLEDTKDTQ